jgi:hypothetical protein
MGPHKKNRRGVSPAPDGYRNSLAELVQRGEEFLIVGQVRRGRGHLGVDDRALLVEEDDRAVAEAALVREAVGLDGALPEKIAQQRKGDPGAPGPGGVGAVSPTFSVIALSSHPRACSQGPNRSFKNHRRAAMHRPDTVLEIHPRACSQGPDRSFKNHRRACIVPPGRGFGNKPSLYFLSTSRPRSAPPRRPS